MDYSAAGWRGGAGRNGSGLMLGRSGLVTQTGRQERTVGLALNEDFRYDRVSIQRPIDMRIDPFRVFENDFRRDLALVDDQQQPGARVGLEVPVADLDHVLDPIRAVDEAVPLEILRRVRLGRVARLVEGLEDEMVGDPHGRQYSVGARGGLAEGRKGASDEAQQEPEV